jgi:hypothetical protein
MKQTGQTLMYDIMIFPELYSIRQGDRELVTFPKSVEYDKLELIVDLLNKEEDVAYDRGWNDRYEDNFDKGYEQGYADAQDV